MPFIFILITATTAGLNLIAIKYGLKDLSPTLLMLLRFGVSSVILAFLLKNKTKILERNKSPFIAKFNKEDLIKLKEPLFIAVYSAAALLCIVIGVSKTTVSNTQAILAFAPILVTIGAHYTANEKNTLTKAISLTLGLVGTLLLILHRTKTGYLDTFEIENIKGNILVFISTILSAIYLIKSKKLSKSFSPLELALAHSITTTLLFFGATVISIFTFTYQHGFTLSVTSIAALLYLIIFGTIINFYTYQKAIKLNSAFMVGMSSYLQIPVAITGGILLFGDKLNWNFLIGMVLILAGSYIGIKKTS